MRDVKFRVWTGDRMIMPGENDTAVWIDGDKWELLSHFTGTLKEVAKRPEGTPVNHQDPACKMMQYVGIRDNSNTEIYEDDYVLCPTHKHFPYRRKCLVSIVKGSVYLSPIHNSVGDYLPNFNYGGLKILGNIHQHKVSIEK